MHTLQAFFNIALILSNLKFIVKCLHGYSNALCWHEVFGGHNYICHSSFTMNWEIDLFCWSATIPSISPYTLHTHIHINTHTHIICTRKGACQGWWQILEPSLGKFAHFQYLIWKSMLMLICSSQFESPLNTYIPRRMSMHVLETWSPLWNCFKYFC